MRTKTIRQSISHTRKKNKTGVNAPHVAAIVPPILTADTTKPDAKESDATDADKEYLIRALSHDVNAYLMVLEFSFRRFDQLAKQLEKSQQDVKTSVDKKNGAKTFDNAVDTNEAWVSGERIMISHSRSPKLSMHSPFETKPERLTDAEPELVIDRLQTTLAEASEHVTACLHETKRFVDDLISFTKTGKIDMEPTVVPIAELVGEVLFEQQQLIDKRQIEVIVSPLLPTVYANRLRIKQLLTNLIRNAAIHGCDSEIPLIMISSEIVQPLHNPQTCQIPSSSFFIRDNGKGIPKLYKERIFEPGYRVPGNQNEGTGVGLAIVRKIARYYQGDVFLQSADTGTTITVVLPQATQ